MVLNGVGLVGRVVPNYIAQRWSGPLNTIIPVVFAASIVLFGWIGVDSVTGLWVFATIYGITAAGIQGLFPVVLTSLTTDQKKAGVRAGMAFSVVVSLPTPLPDCHTGLLTSYGSRDLLYLLVLP